MIMTVACLIERKQNSLVYSHEKGKSRDKLKDLSSISWCYGLISSHYCNFISLNTQRAAVEWEKLQERSVSVAHSHPLPHTLSSVGPDMAATWLPSLVLTQPFKAAWPPVPITKVCSWNRPMKTSMKSLGGWRTNAFLFWINKTGKAIKSLVQDLFIINYCGTMQPHCEHTCVCCGHVPLCRDRSPCAHAGCTQAPLFFTLLLHLLLSEHTSAAFLQNSRLHDSMFNALWNGSGVKSHVQDALLLIISLEEGINEAEE